MIYNILDIPGTYLQCPWYFMTALKLAFTISVLFVAIYIVHPDLIGTMSGSETGLAGMTKVENFVYCVLGQRGEQSPSFF